MIIKAFETIAKLLLAAAWLATTFGLFGVKENNIIASILLWLLFFLFYRSDIIDLVKRLRKEKREALNDPKTKGFFTVAVAITALNIVTILLTLGKGK